jgi:hypothetical protein
MDRREFARWLSGGALGSVVASTTSAVTIAAEEQTSDESPPVPTERAPTPAELLLTTVYLMCPGEHWTPETLRDVLGDIESDLERGRILSAFPLTNGDDPATIFPAIVLPADRGSSP